MVDLLLPLDAVAKFGTPTITISLAWAWVSLLKGCKGFGREQEEGGEKKCPLVSIAIGTMTGLTQIFYL